MISNDNNNSEIGNEVGDDNRVTSTLNFFLFFNEI
jgi:hypothetical protein